MISTHKTLPITIFLFTLLLTLHFSACNDLEFSDNPNDRIHFSKDTVSFDTVFSTIGSANSKLLVYNSNKKALKITDIRLGGGASSPFKINVDGTKSALNQFSNLEIYGNDSLYVFISVTVNPQSANSPVLLEDSLSFVTNGVRQRIILQAYGQDVTIFDQKTILHDTTLTAKKPYLIKGNLTIDTAKTLTIEPGARLYFHNNANLVVYGNLKAEGTLAAPILMRGDRMDKIRFTTPVPYNYIAGQWGGIKLLWKGGHHILNHVKINSAYAGIYLANSDRNYTLPSLEIANSIIHNMILYGIYLQNADLTIKNSEISNTGSYCLYLNGGTHLVVQSTIANYFGDDWQPISRDGSPAVMLSELEHIAPMSSTFQNSVITGNISNEFSIASKFVDKFVGNFDHCYIRKSTASTTPQFSHIRWYQDKDTLFTQTKTNIDKGQYYDFSPYTRSPLHGLADPAIIDQYNLQFDMNGVLRDNQPDAGAYEGTH